MLLGMDPVTTQEQMTSFLGLLSHATGSVYSALYYAGVFIGFIVFPIYGVVLLRRQTRKYMEKILSEIAERDPWLWAAAQGMDMFDTERPFRWLEDLCRWQARYHGVKIFFGSPDLEAKCIQATKALANVFLSWAQDVNKLKPDKKERLVGLLQRLNERSADPDIGKLLALISSPDDPLQWIQDLRKDADEIRSWYDMLEALDLPSDTKPEEAAAKGHATKQEIAKALLVFARKEVPCRGELHTFLRALHQHSTGTVRITAIHVDKALGAKGELLAALKDMLEGADAGTDLQKLKQHPAWQKFVIAFGHTPFEVLEAHPEDGFASLQSKYRARIGQVPQEAAQERKSLDLAWDVILLLRKDRLLAR